MRGTLTVPFHTLFADTVQTHGADWAKMHYIKGGMPAWEFSFWLNACTHNANGV